METTQLAPVRMFTVVLLSAPPHPRLRVLLPLLALSGCISTRLVNLDNLDVPLPTLAAEADWRAHAAALFDQYERAPVLAPEDERLEPLFGGLTTLSYFGADAEPRVRDQQIPAQARARGHALEAACALPLDPQAPDVFATARVPEFTPVWVPLSAAGGAAPASTRCDEHGHASGGDGHTVFCMFGRLALQATAGRTLIVVVHGMFDSGAQEYVQRMAAVLYGLGHSVLVPDMRDHGDTLRATPELATTFGTLEGPDVLALVDAARRACGSRIGRAGVAGVSGGGLDAVRAFTLDRGGSLDAGVIAFSPLLDVAAAVSDLTHTGACPLTRSIELSWSDDLAVAAASGAAFFGGAALARGFAGEHLDGATALAAGVGAGIGLLASLAVDAWFDGGTQPCVADNAIARIVQDALRVRWRALLAPGLGTTMSPAGMRITPEALSITDYVRERCQFLAARQGVTLRQFDAPTLARELRLAAEGGKRPAARLLVVGADDDPMTRVAALRRFSELTTGMPQVYTRIVRHGGHGAMWMVQPTIMKAVVEQFFAARSAAASAGQ